VSAAELTKWLARLCVLNWTFPGGQVLEVDVLDARLWRALRRETAVLLATDVIDVLGLANGESSAMPTGGGPASRTGPVWDRWKTRPGTYSPVLLELEDETAGSDETDAVGESDVDA
ncbi:hypothetical protein AAVH_36873, partial [Aphelenchoides avenae]